MKNKTGTKGISVVLSFSPRWQGLSFRRGTAAHHGFGVFYVKAGWVTVHIMPLNLDAFVETI